jgi:hypothetical protein
VKEKWQIKRKKDGLWKHKNGLNRGPSGYILSCGKKGLKAQEVKAAGKR